MRYLIHFVLLLALCSTQAMASDSHIVELVVFRQGGESLSASRVAPDNWAQGATPITADMLRSTHLNHLTDKLTPANGYEILFHQAWLQHSTDGTAKVAVSTGPDYFDHYPVEGTLSFVLDRTSSVQLDLWINQFNPDKTLRSSEQLQQKTIVANDQVTFVDHYPLGALIRIQAQNSPTQSIKTVNPEDFE